METDIKERKIRVALIGCGGRTSEAHGPALASFSDVEIAAICDVNAERLNAFGEKFEVDRRYTDYRRMVEEAAPDAVYAVGQPYHMFDIWTWVLSQGQNLFIEKPLGITVHQARALAWLAQERGSITQVCFQRRYNPIFAKMKQACDDRGGIVHAVCTFYKPGPQPFISAIDHLYEDGTHVVDTLRWICGGEAVSVASRIGNIGTPDVNLSLALINFDTGATGVMLTTFCSGRRVFRVEMHGPGVTVESDENGPARLHVDGDVVGTEIEDVDGRKSARSANGRATVAVNRNFIDHLRAGTMPDTNFDDAVKTIELTDRVLHAEI